MSAGIAIVVVSYNTKESLRLCLRDYLSQIGSEDEIVVVDNRSSDGTIEMLASEFPSLRVIVSPTNAGFSYACNTGYRATQAPLVLFSNGDIHAAPGALDAARKKLQEHSNVGVFSPELLGEGGKLIQM